MNYLFNYICKNYIQAKSEAFKNHELGEILRNDLPNEIYSKLNLDKNIFKITGSIGQGNWAEIPWLSIFIKDITISATNGYYIVYLFKSDMSGFYLSLNQGWTYFKNKYGTKNGKQKILETSRILKEKLSPISDTFNKDKINLLDSGNLGKGYELGHICGCYYDIENIPSDKKLINDLKELINEYLRLKKIIGIRSTNEFNDYILLNSDNKFLDNVEEDQKFINKVEDIISSYLNDTSEITPKEIIDTPAYPPSSPRNSNNKKVWSRNATVASNALIHSSYKCTLNPEHNSFISKKTKKPYMETHHLIPLSKQDNFEFSLDVEANIVSLCSNCHNCIHYGIDEDKIKILNELFKLRKDRLSKCGINITFNYLLDVYNISENIIALNM
ncbi:MAG: MrcB family domain-containing protein [Clostridium perfringens]